MLHPKSCDMIKVSAIRSPTSLWMHCLTGVRVCCCASNTSSILACSAASVNLAKQSLHKPTWCSAKAKGGDGSFRLQPNSFVGYHWG